MKLLIVDDDALVTQGIKTILEAEAAKRQDELDIVALGSSGREAVDLYKAHRPDLVLMDIRMPGMTGIEAGKVIMDLDPEARIIYLTTFLEDDYIIQALSLGAKGYIVKTDFASIYPALEAAMHGQRIFGEEIMDKAIQLADMGPRSQEIKGLSPKEAQLTYWVAQGLSNQEIAEKMHFSEGTIRNYISDLLDKLDLRNRTQLAIYYYKNGGGD